MKFYIDVAADLLPYSIICTLMDNNIKKCNGEILCLLSEEKSKI